jgi:radical SAM superfamily enzyme YgiQ (UPF0313 family)
MRAIINKPLDEAVILETARTIFEHGWLSLKLYFMIGLPRKLWKTFRQFWTLPQD